MNDLHLLRYCAAILCVCVLPGCIRGDRSTPEYATSVTFHTSAPTVMMTTTATVAPVDSSLEPSPEGPISTTNVAQPTTNLIPSDATKAKFLRRECVSVLMVTGGLIVGCTILLVTTLMLVWKVCQLNRRLRALGSNDDLISNSGYWIGTGRKNKKSKRKSEAAETSMLLTGFSQTQEPRDNGADKEEEGTATFGGQKEEEKQALDTVQSGEVLADAPEITAENPKEKVENPNPQDNNVDATSPECKEETKAVV